MSICETALVPFSSTSLLQVPPWCQLATHALPASVFLLFCTFCIVSFLISCISWKISQALASPEAARALARVLPLSAAVAPILAAQRDVLSGTPPAEYPRAPVEIVLVALTLVAQLGLALSDRCGAEARLRELDDGFEEDNQAVDERGSGARSSRMKMRRRRRRERRERRQWKRDVARSGRLRRFLGEVAAAGEVKLCLGHAACRAESKDLARRAAFLISLLQAGVGDCGV